MAHLNWKYAQNMFLRATEQRRPLMLRIGADHVAKLTAKLGSPADPDGRGACGGDLVSWLQQNDARKGMVDSQGLELAGGERLVAAHLDRQHLPRIRGARLKDPVGDRDARHRRGEVDAQAD